MRNIRTMVLVILAVSTPLMAAHIRAVGLTPSPIPRAVYGTVSSFDNATMTLTLLEGGIVVDVSKARVVGTDGRDTLNPIRKGLQVSIQLNPPSAAGAPLSAWLVEQKTMSPASLTGTVDSIDLGAGTFTVDGVVIHVTANTIWKGARGSDVRSLGELQLGQDVNLDLDRDSTAVVAQQIFVVGFIPPMFPNFFGFVTNIAGDLWTITTADNGPVVVRVTDRTIFNSTDGVAQPALGEFVEVTTDGGNPAIALVITDFPPPQQQIQFSYSVFGTLSAVDSSSLTVTDLNGYTVALPTDANTKYYRGAKIGDYVEVRVRVDDATKTQVVVQVIKTNRTIRLGGTGTVKSIEGNVWTIDIWTVIVSPQTRIINNPRVGDKVRFVGTTEHGSNTIQAEEIERL